MVSCNSKCARFVPALLLRFGGFCSTATTPGHSCYDLSSAGYHYAKSSSEADEGYVSFCFLLTHYWAGRKEKEQVTNNAYSMKRCFCATSRRLRQMPEYPISCLYAHRCAVWEVLVYKQYTERTLCCLSCGRPTQLYICQTSKIVATPGSEQT